jgi:hypothetical protein
MRDLSGNETPVDDRMARAGPLSQMRDAGSAI